MIGRIIPVHGSGAPRVPGILSMEMPGVSAEAMHQRLPEICFGPMVSCNSLTGGRVVNPTHAALGLTAQQSCSTLLISLGWTTSEDELQRALHLIAAAYESLVQQD